MTEVGNEEWGETGVTDGLQRNTRKLLGVMDFSNGFMGVHVSKLIKLYALTMYSLLNIDYIPVEFVFKWGE